MSLKAFVLTTSLFMVFHFSSGAFDLKQCYKCEYFEYEGTSATNDEQCKENPPPEKFLVNCTDAGDASEWQCVKITGRIEIDEENHNYYKRACSPGKNYVTCKECKDTKTYETQYGFVKRGKHCACDDKDGCNSASGFAIGVSTLIVGVLAVVTSRVQMSACVFGP